MKVASTVPVMMYHHVTPEGGMINASPEHFEQHLQWLQRHGWTSLTTEQFVGHLQGQGVPPKSVLITFDDGYLDNWVYAYPLLKKYGFNAVIFLVTDWIKDGPVRPYLGQGQDVPACPEHRECEARIEQGRSDEVILRWSEIHAMQADGVFEFHSHTHTHTRWDLSEQRDQKNDKMRWELEQSRKTLMANMDGVSDQLCWPQGYFDSDYVQIAQQAGFRYLYTTKAFGSNQPGSDPLHIYRFAVRDTTGVSVGRRLNVAIHPVIGPIFNRWKAWRRRQRQK
ncbi:MAG: polysaccharide deacetylase family protein [Alcaligenes sp.]